MAEETEVPRPGHFELEGPLAAFAPRSKGWAKRLGSSISARARILPARQSLGGAPNARILRAAGRAQILESGRRTSGDHEWQGNLDEAAIKEVCFNETWGSHHGDPELWASSWLQRDDCSLIGIFWDTGLFAKTGWAEIEAAVRPYAEAKATGTGEFLAFRHAGHRIKVIGDMACATFTETNWHISDVDRKNPMELLEHRVLERQDGRWNIAQLIFIPVRNITHDRAHIRVDASGRVAQISPAIRAALANSGLTISAGRLRAVQPKWDRELQATIARMHGLTGFSATGRGLTPRGAIPGPRRNTGVSNPARRGRARRAALLHGHGHGR